MISPWMTKIVNVLPDRFVSYMSKKLLNKYINKYANLEVDNEEVLKKDLEKPVIYICNHLSNSDALMINKLLSKYDDVTYVAGVKLADNSLTKLGLNLVKTTPVRPNTADREGIKKIINLIKGGNSLCIFPEGTRSRTGSMIEGKKGITLIAKMTKASIIPLGITGTEKLLPINKEGSMEKETFHYSDVKINVGNKYFLPKINEGESKKEYEDRCLEIIMNSIADLIPEEYRGVYSKQ
ncbi:lysophospholipid acyltransferase family protein [Clostridium sp. DL1XJH146]